MRIKPYGDTMGDGYVQLSFTLPIGDKLLAEEAARVLLSKMGFQEVKLAWVEPLDENFTFFVAYGSTIHDVDISQLNPVVPEYKKMSKKEVEKFAEKHIGKKLKVVGATIGSDAHTVGLDSILNMKGYRGEKGLEAYSCFQVYNLGAQVPPEELVRKVKELGAEVILVSQVVTQKNIHIKNLTKLVDLLEAEGLRDKVILIAGGPRISHRLAQELGYDAGFGPDTYPNDVASFIVQNYVKRFKGE